MKGRNGNVLRGALCLLCALLWALPLFFPLPRTLSAGAGESYLCRWESGEETQETYASALRDLDGMEEGVLVLGRDGMRGEISPGTECENAVSVLENGNMGELFALRTEGLARLERAALYRAYGERLWYAGEWFGWTGEAFARRSAGEAEEVVLLSGKISAARLLEAGTKTLFLRAEAEIDETTLCGTRVETVSAEEPYRAEGGCVCLSTAGGVRLVAGLPLATQIIVPADTAFADEGALLACTEIAGLTLPFVGSAKNSAGSGFKGELAHLFSTGEQYKIPQTLRKIRVTGGSLVSHAFYACSMLEEIDACGLGYDDIAYDAFADCTGLRLLHTPRGNVRLPGNFRISIAPCGCTVFERIGEANG